MKNSHLSVLALSLSLILAACGGGATTTPTDPVTTPATPATIPTPTPTTATLTLNVSGPASAPVKVTDSSGNVRFDGTVSGSASVPNLPRASYTVTAGAVTNYTAPAVQTADLSSGNGAVTLAYTALPGTALDPNTVGGVIPNWKSGAASAALAHVYYTSAGLFSSTAGVVSPAGTVAADGALNITLPSSLDASYIYSLFSTSCTFTGTTTDPTFQSDWYGRRLIQVGDSPLGVAQEFVSGSPADSRHFVYRVYVPADTTVKGTESCNSSAMYAYTDTYDLKLSKGWNTVEGFKTGTPNTGSVYDNYTYQSLAAGSRVELQYTPFTPGVQLALSDSSALTLKRGDKATRSLKITQLGNYSGTVSLGSSVAGVSVDPATVTLAPVTSQAIKALSAQAQSDPRARQRLEMEQALTPASVSTTLTFTASADAAAHTGTSTDLLSVKDASGTTLASTSLPITVSVPSVSGSVYVSSLDRGQSQTSSVYLYSNNNYSGPVTISMENLPDGVSAPSVQTTYPTSTSPTLTFTASATAVTGAKTAQLVVNAGGVITKTDVIITVNKPGVQVSLNNSVLTARRGQTQNVTVQVSSRYGFSGSTTISLSGLPAGVSASPLTVNVTAGTTTTAAIPVTVSDSAAYGTTTVKIESADLDTTAYNQPLSLAVASPVTATLGESVQIATAGKGIWTISSGGRYVSGGSSYTLSRYEGSTLVLTKTLLLNSVGTLLTTPSGDLVIVGYDRISVVRADGTVTSVMTSSSATNYPKVVDAQNRLWYAEPSSGSGATLNTLDLSTGAVSTVSGLGQSSTYFSMYRNASGSTLYLTSSTSSGNSSAVITQIDSATATKTKDISLPGGSYVSSLAVAQDGTLWGNASSPFRLNTDGTITSFSALPSLAKLMFDTVSSTTLWGYSGSNVYRIDTTTGTATIIPTGNVSDIAIDKAGGLWTFISYYDSGSSNNILSLVN